MKFVILTGLSGAGKSEAMKALEDIGFYCVDNIPPSLVVKFAELCYSNRPNFEKVALGIDIRGRSFFDELEESLGELEEMGYKHEIVFLESDDNILIQRYKMTRRNHPLAENSGMEDGIKKERELMEVFRKRAQKIINTSNMKPKDLQGEIKHIYLNEEKQNTMIISVNSFGFKHGLPMDSDLVFDVRFLPNPYYEIELRPLTGENEEVRRFVMDSEISLEFFEKLKDMMKFLVPNYIEEGKNHLVVSIGCTGGRHRSVTIANLLYDYLKESGYRVIKKHRDYKLS